MIILGILTACVPHILGLTTTQNSNLSLYHMSLYATLLSIRDTSACIL